MKDGATIDDPKQDSQVRSELTSLVIPVHVEPPRPTRQGAATDGVKRLANQVVKPRSLRFPRRAASLGVGATGRANAPQASANLDDHDRVMSEMRRRQRRLTAGLCALLGLDVEDQPVLNQTPAEAADDDKGIWEGVGSNVLTCHGGKASESDSANQVPAKPRSSSQAPESHEVEDDMADALAVTLENISAAGNGLNPADLPTLPPEPGRDASPYPLAMSPKQPRHTISIEHYRQRVKGEAAEAPSRSTQSQPTPAPELAPTPSRP